VAKNKHCTKTESSGEIMRHSVLTYFIFLMELLPTSTISSLQIQQAQLSAYSSSLQLPQFQAYRYNKRSYQHTAVHCNFHNFKPTDTTSAAISTQQFTATAIWCPSKAHRTANQTTHHRRPGIRSCSLARVEQSSVRCHFCQLTPVFQKTTENFSF